LRLLRTATCGNYQYEYRGSTVALTDQNGNVTCQHEYSAYGTFTYRTGNTDTLFQFNGPNDVWIAPNGGLYFTDPFYRRACGRHRQMPQDGQHVYYVTHDRKSIVRVVSDLKQPNGVPGTSDGKRLFVADVGAGRIRTCDVNPDGAFTKRRCFANSVPMA